MRLLLWLSRLSRPDLSFTTTRLEGRVSTWTKFEDRQLHRCIAYSNKTVNLVLAGAAEHGSIPRLDVFTDADFASCRHSAKSTSGQVCGFLRLQVAARFLYTGRASTKAA